MSMVSSNTILAMQNGQAGTPVTFIPAADIEAKACEWFKGSCGTGQYCPFHLFNVNCVLKAISGHTEKYHHKGAGNHLNQDQIGDIRKRAAKEVQNLTCKRPKFKA